MKQEELEQGRREIGHGKLAWRALNSSLPEQENFPILIELYLKLQSQMVHLQWQLFVVRSLALMDAGVPMKTPVAGIAMGFN